MPKKTKSKNPLNSKQIESVQSILDSYPKLGYVIFDMPVIRKVGRLRVVSFHWTSDTGDRFFERVFMCELGRYESVKIKQ